MSRNYNMESVAEDLESILVGRRIVSAERVKGNWRTGKDYSPREPYIKLTLDNGAIVEIEDTSDCCAYGKVSAFLLNPDSVDHVITSVKSHGNLTEFFVLADMVQVLRLDTSWSEGSGYYSYGLNIRLRDSDASD